MNRTLRLGTLLAALIGTALFLVQQGRTQSSCSTTVTGVSVGSVTVPSNGQYLTQNNGFNPQATYSLDWTVPAHPPLGCSDTISWQYGGSTNDPQLTCSKAGLFSDTVSNVSNNNGGSGTFSHSKSWSCTAATLGNWNFVFTDSGGSNNGTRSVPYSVVSP